MLTRWTGVRLGLVHDLSCDSIPFRYKLLILDPLALGDNNVKSEGTGFEHHPFAVLAVARLNTLIVEVTFMNLWMVGEVHP